jgi:hypothetical protein
MNTTLTLDAQWQLRLPDGTAKVFGDAGVATSSAVPQALADALAALPARSLLTVQVAGARARWLLLPDSPRLVGERAWAAFAQARFEQQQAQAAGPWTLRWLAEAPGHPRLLTALPNSLVEALRAACGRLSWSLRVRTCERLAAWRARQPRFTGAVCDLDAQGCVLILCHRGRPVRVRKRAGAVDAAALLSMLQTEWSLSPAAAQGPCTQLVWASSEAWDESQLTLLRQAGVHTIPHLTGKGNRA